jgi:CubicO group peptidase (beta-lactamase class C family)
MVHFKRWILALATVILWTVLVGYAALSGWWLKPIAAKGDTQAFWNAAVKIADARSRGDIALVLIRNGAVFAERFTPSIDAVDRKTLFPLASTSKWIAAYGVMQLVQAGKIDLDAPVSRYLERWQLPAGKFDAHGVTVRRLLSHTAGLTDELGFGDYRADETLPSLEAELQHPRASNGTAIIAVGREPGGAWQYSGGGYLILQLLVEDVSGVSFAQWMQQAVFDPIGMQRSTYDFIGERDNASKSYAADGKLAASYQYAAAAATGLSSSVEDLSKFIQAQLHGGRPQLLSQAMVDAMRQPLGRKWGADIWGMGVMLYAPTASGNYVFGHDGANEPAINSAVRINPDNGDAVIALVSGNPKLASAIAYEWTLWQTGAPDFLMLNRAIDSALTPWLLGILLILGMFAYVVVRRKPTQLARH